MSLDRTSELKRTGPPRRRSPKREAMEYQAFVIAELLRQPRCQLADRIAEVDPLWTGCRRKATGLHHLRKRSSAGAITCSANTLSSCDPCNGWVEDHPKLARLAKLVIRAEDRELWEQLGARYHAEHHEGTT